MRKKQLMGVLVAAAVLGVVATSANLAGKRAPRSAEGVLKQLDGRIELLLDGGKTRYGRASTIVAFDGEEYTIVRPGVYDGRKIEKMTRRSILFVCTGNTCRSPIAAGLTKKLLAECLGCKVGQLDRLGQEVLSAGALTSGGSPPTHHAVAAAARHGANIREHTSRRLTNGLINAADLVFCMTRRHIAEVTGAVPDAAGKTFLLDPAGDIRDPIGGDADVYERVAGRIDRSLKERIRENLL